MQLKALLAVLLALSSIEAGSSQHCNTGFLNAYGFDGIQKAVEQPMLLCKGVESKCCSYMDELKFHKTWNHYYKLKMEKTYDYIPKLFEQMKNAERFLTQLKSSDLKGLFTKNETIIDAAIGNMTSVAVSDWDSANELLKAVRAKDMEIKEKFICYACSMKTHMKISEVDNKMVFKPAFCDRVISGFGPYMKIKLLKFDQFLLKANEFLNLLEITSKAYVKNGRKLQEMSKTFEYGKKCLEGSFAMRRCKNLCARFSMTEISRAFVADVDLLRSTILRTEMIKKIFEAKAAEKQSKAALKADSPAGDSKDAKKDAKKSDASAEKKTEKKEEKPAAKAPSKKKLKTRLLSERFRRSWRRSRDASPRHSWYSHPYRAPYRRYRRRLHSRIKSIHRRGREPRFDPFSFRRLQKTNSKSKSSSTPTSSSKSSSKSTSEPAATSSSKSTSEPAATSSSKSTSEPATKSSSKSTSEPATKSSSKSTSEPATKSSSKSTSESAPKSTSKSSSKSTSTSSSKSTSTPAVAATKEATGAPVVKSETKKIKKTETSKIVTPIFDPELERAKMKREITSKIYLRIYNGMKSATLEEFDDVSVLSNQVFDGTFLNDYQLYFSSRGSPFAFNTTQLFTETKDNFIKNFTLALETRPKNYTQNFTPQSTFDIVQMINTFGESEIFDFRNNIEIAPAGIYKGDVLDADDLIEMRKAPKKTAKEEKKKDGAKPAEAKKGKAKLEL